MVNNKSIFVKKRKSLKKTISNVTTIRPKDNLHYSHTLASRKRLSVQLNFVKVFNDILQNDNEDLLSDINFLDEINHKNQMERAKD